MDITKISASTIAEIAEAKEASPTKAVENIEEIQTSQEVETADKVEWSDKGEFFVEALNEVKNSPDVRMEKIAQMKDAIKNGTYKVDSEAVSEKMLEHFLSEDLVLNSGS